VTICPLAAGLVNDNKMAIKADIVGKFFIGIFFQFDFTILNGLV
jgi:hypothetical protein